MADRARPQHPSGRPIRNNERKSLSIWRVPGEGPVIPGLRRKELQPAIGFTAGNFHTDEDDDEWQN